MPTYDYKCSECGHQFERFLSISRRLEPESEECPECKKENVKLYITGEFRSTQPEFKPPEQLNEFLKVLKKNTKGASDFRTY